MLQSSGFFVPQTPLPDQEDGGLELLHTSEEGHCLVLKGHRNDRMVVYKCLKPEFREDPVLQRMLRREFEIGTSLKHPGICEILSWTVLPGYGDSIEMEWIDGCPLDEWAAAHPGDTAQARRILMDLCDALAYLHHKQVIHKDLKPANILITRQGAYVKILDFGLSDTDSILTGKDPGGTWSYAAPEVLRGEAADERSDIYSLGRIMRKMGPVFSRIARRCTEEDKDKRFSSAEEVRQALGHAPRNSLARWIVPVLAVLAAAGILWAVLGQRNPVEQLFLDAVEQVQQAAKPS